MTPTHQVKIGKLTRDLPIIQLPSGIKIALFNSISDTEAVLEAAKELAKRMPQDIDVMVTPEAKSIPLTFALAVETGLPYVVARKTCKPYMGDAVQADVNTITTGGKQTLYLDEKDIHLLKNKNVVLVDDVVSTGSTVQNLQKLVEVAGGQVAKIMAVFTEGDEEKWSDVISLGHLPLEFD